MADLKKLQEMAKSGELSKKLLEDEKFKTEFKKVLEEENGIEITDDDIYEIIEDLQSSLKSGKSLNENELENVSGGVVSKKKMAIIMGSKLLGAAIGAGVAKYKTPKIDRIAKTDRYYSNLLYGSVGGHVGGGIIGTLACKALGID